MMQQEVHLMNDELNKGLLEMFWHVLTVYVSMKLAVFPKRLMKSSLSPSGIWTNSLTGYRVDKNATDIQMDDLKTLCYHPRGGITIDNYFVVKTD